MGVREQIIFPEIDYDSIDQVRGLDVTITTTAKTDEEAYILLRELGMPFAPEGAPGSHDEPEEDAAEAERREEARLKAEAEAAAYEELKEENPEAYEAPAASEDDEGEERRQPGGRRDRGVMAKTSQRVRQQRGSKYKTRNYNRCKRCGRPRAYVRKFGLCRICLREIAHEGMIPGLTKSSW